MASESTVLETAQKIDALTRDHEEVIALWKEAQKVFDKHTPLEEIQELKASAWVKLVSGRPDLAKRLDFGNVMYCLDRVLDAQINRKELFNCLHDEFQLMEGYIKCEEEEIAKQKAKLDELYDDFAQEGVDNRLMSAILQAPGVKEAILNKFLMRS